MTGAGRDTAADREAADLRIDKHRLRTELDAALATIATLSDRLRDKDRTIARLERNNGVLRCSYKSKRAELAALAVDPRPEMHATIERLDVEHVSKVDDGVSVVPERIRLVIAEPRGKRGVWFERVKYSTLVHPDIDDLSARSVPDGPAQHEPVATEDIEHHGDVEERLVPQEDVDVAHRDPAAVAHDDDATGASSTPEDGAA